MQVSGIILGMLLMGYIADQIGRKWGSVLTSAFMFIGGILLTCSTGPTIQGWAIMFAVSQFIFGYGVGGAPTLHHVCDVDLAGSVRALLFHYIALAAVQYSVLPLLCTISCTAAACPGFAWFTLRCICRRVPPGVFQRF